MTAWRRRSFVGQVLLGATTWPWLRSARAAPSATLRVGVLPNLSTGVLLTNYQPLRAHLARELGRPVELFTAKGFTNFYRAMQAGQFDLVVTAAHMARLAQREAGWAPIATYRVEHRPLLLMARSNPLVSVMGLAGGRLAIADRAALLVIAALQGLAAQGLRAGRDFRLVEFPTFNAAAHALQQGEVQLAVGSPVSMRQTPLAVRRDLVVFQTLPRVPSQVWLVAPPLRREAPRLQAALLKFAPGSADADRFFEVTGNVAIDAIGADELRALDAMADEAKALMLVRP